MKGTAPESALAALHNELAQAFTARIKSGDASPSDLNAARQFLKDNNIACVPDNNPEIQELVKAIPTTDELDGMVIGGKAQ